MEVRNNLNQTTTRSTTAKENPKRGVDHKAPLIGSAVKRKRLSDITNTVGCSRSSAQIQENPSEITCAVTKECVSQLMEENATLLKTLGERSKIVELSSIELQKLRVAVEKVNQQNRMMTQANSQMLAELTLSKERLKGLQHELGCTVAVVKLKNSELNEKEKLIKELRNMIRVEERGSKHIEVATNASEFQIVNNGASRMDRDSELEDKRPDKELCERTGAKDCSMEIATDASVSNPSNSTDCNTRKRSVRNKSSLGSNTSTVQEESKEKSVNQQHEVIAEEEEKLNGGLCEEIRAEEHSKFVNMTTTDASLPNPFDSNADNGSNRKRTLRSQSLGPATLTQIEAKDKNKTRTSTRRCNNRKSEPLKSKDHSIDTADTEIPATATLIEVKEKSNTRRTSSQRISNNKQSEPMELKDHLFQIVDPEIPVCSVDEENSVQAESSATLTQQVEEKEKDDRRRRKSSQRRSNSLKLKTYKSEDSNEAVNAKPPACSSIVEPPSEVNPLHGKTSVPSNSDTSVKPKEDQKEQSSSSQCHDLESRRTSVGRPMRRAAEKVSSYKEPPLNVKMRRPE